MQRLGRQNADPPGQLGSVQSGHLMAHCKACLWQSCRAAGKFYYSRSAPALRGGC
jgi:hypothetical protein